MGKYQVTVDLTRCTAYTGCPLKCLAACPTKVLAHRPLNPTDESAGVVIQATHPLLCDGCMACVEACETGAVRVGT